MAKKKKANWFTYFMSTLGGICVLAGMFFGITYGIPSIREKVWTPDTTTNQVENADTNTELDNTNTEE